MSQHELSQLLSQINLTEQDQIINMPQNNGQTIQNPPAVNYQLLRLHIDIIPSYEGNPHTLNVFLDSCETLINSIRNYNDQSINNLVIRAILGKLTGRALSLIGSRIELRAWTDIKSALTLSFGDQRNIDCLLQDLLALHPDRNETPYNYGMRCQDARSLLISKLNSLNIPINEKQIKLVNYEDLALKTFIKGLTGQLQNNVRLRNPPNLETAMSLVIEEENFLYSQNKSNALNSQNNHKPINRFTPVNIKPNHSFPPRQPITPQYPYQPTQYNRPIFNNSTSYNPFQKPNSGIKPNPPRFVYSPQQWRYNTQQPSRNFNNPPNFNTFNKPYTQHAQIQQNPPIRQYVPEPMETSTIRPIRNNNNLPMTNTRLYAQNIDEYNVNEDPYSYGNFDYYSNDQNYYNIPENPYEYQEITNDINFECNELPGNQEPTQRSVPENASQQNTSQSTDFDDVNFHIIASTNAIT